MGVRARKKYRSRNYEQAAVMWRAFRNRGSGKIGAGPHHWVCEKFVRQDREDQRYYLPNGKLKTPQDFYGEHPKERPEET